MRQSHHPEQLPAGSLDGYGRLLNILSKVWAALYVSLEAPKLLLHLHSVRLVEKASSVVLIRRRMKTMRSWKLPVLPILSLVLSKRQLTVARVLGGLRSPTRLL
mmetsp:Transcript_43691/g.86188  ORF Transcript_43691/g.86188 Transcript_43691/m.86188 type:complete len:104 (+) Transcript_43691:300-611(+)